MKEKGRTSNQGENIKVGKRVRGLREEKGLTQKEFVKALQVSQQSISGIELDQIQITLNTLVDVADFFGVTTDYLIGRSERRESADRLARQIDRFDEFHQIIALYEEMNPMNREIACELLKSLLKVQSEKQ